MVAQSGFHFSTLEEFYTGGLFLGPGNGITDGSVPVLVVFILTGCIGNSWFLTKVAGDVTWKDVFVYYIGTTVFLLDILCVVNIFRKTHEKGNKVPLGQLAVQIVGYFVPQGLLAALLYVGQRPIIYRVPKDEPVSLLFLIVVLMNFMM